MSDYYGRAIRQGASGYIAAAYERHAYALVDSGRAATAASKFLATVDMRGLDAALALYGK